MKPKISAVCISRCKTLNNHMHWHAPIGGLKLTPANNVLCLSAVCDVIHVFPLGVLVGCSYTPVTRAIALLQICEKMTGLAQE